MGIIVLLLILSMLGEGNNSLPSADSKKRFNNSMNRELDELEQFEKRLREEVEA